MRNLLFVVLLLVIAKIESAAAEPVQIVPSDFGKCQQPQIAVSSNGVVNVVFGKKNSIYFVQSKKGVMTFSTPQLVGELPKLALGMRRGPRIATDKKNIVISAISHEDGNLYAWNSSNRRNWSKKTVINDVPNAAREGLHGLAANGQGSCFSVWLDLRNGSTEIWGALSKNNGKTWAKNIRIYKSPDGNVCECCHPSVIFTAENKIAVMWRNWLNGSRDMFLAVSEDGGNTFGNAQKLGLLSWALNACPMDGGGLASQRGEIVSAWRRGNSVFVTVKEGNEIFVGDGTQPTVAFSNGQICVVWQQKQKLLWDTVPATNARVLSENGSYPAIIALNKPDEFVAVWEFNGTLFLDTMESK